MINSLPATTVHPNGSHTDPNPLGELTPTGWIAPTQMNFEQWVNIGRTIGEIDNSVNWWVGDWLLTGERKWGSRYLQAVHVLGWNEQRLMDTAYVARNVPPAQRKANLSWSHHKAIAPYSDEPEKQEEYLTTAEAEGLSVNEFRVVVLEAEGKPLPRNGCLECQKWLQAIGNADLCVALAEEQGWGDYESYLSEEEVHLAAAVYLSKRFPYMSIRTGDE